MVGWWPPRLSTEPRCFGRGESNQRWMVSGFRMGADAVDGLRLQEQLLGYALALVVYAQRAVEALVELDPSVSEGSMVRGRWDVEDAGLKADGVVVEHDTSVFEAEEVIKATLLRPGDPSQI